MREVDREGRQDKGQLRYRVVEKRAVEIEEPVELVGVHCNSKNGQQK